jgi:hypothetical protein
MAEERYSSRKRSRSASPVPPSTQSNLDLLSDVDARLVKGLRDPLRRTAALNELLQLSASHETNYSVSGDPVLRELADIAIYDCLKWKEPIEKDSAPVFRSQQTWLSPPTSRMAAWAKHCKNQLDPKRSKLQMEHIRMLEVILVILRNLSFVGANLRLLVYSPDILAVLVGCLYEGYDQAYSITVGNDSSGSGSNMTLALSAIQTLIHLAPHLDVSGQKLLSDKLFYASHLANDGPIVPNASTFGQTASGQWGFGGIWLAKRLDTKEDTVSDVNKEFVLSLTADQLVAVWSMFSGITNLLTDPQSPRPVILMTLDLLQEAINHARVGVVGSVQLENNDDEIPTIRAILVSMPDTVMERLTDFLYVPRLGPDSLDYVDPVHHIVTRVTTLKLLMGYDATVDTDVRDRTLDVLVPLLELDSPRMAARLGRDMNGQTRTRLFDALFPILTTTVGRNEASMLAAQLFREISKSEDNRVGLLYVQERLIELASRDPRVSQLVWNHLLPDSSAEEAVGTTSGEED